MDTRTKFAFWIYLLLTIAGAAWGIGFLLRTEFTSYHGAAAGVPWSEVPANFRIVILALTKLAGGLWVASALSVLVLLLIPFRRGSRWALWAVPLLMLVGYIAPMPAMSHLSANSPSNPPWVLTMACIAVTLLALVVSVSGKRSAREHTSRAAAHE